MSSLSTRSIESVASLSSRYGTSYTAPAGSGGSSTSAGSPARTSGAVAANSKSPTNVGAIAGGVAGGIAGLLLIGGVAYYLIKKHAQSRRDAALDDDLFGAAVGVGALQPAWPDVHEAGGQGASTYGDPFGGQGAGGLGAGSAPSAQQPAAWSPYQQAGYGGGGAEYGPASAGAGPGYGYDPTPAGVDGAGAGYGGGPAGHAGWGPDAGAGWSHDAGMGASAGPGPSPGASPWSPGSGAQGSQMSQLSPNDTGGTAGLVATWAQAQRQQTQTPDARQSVLSHPASTVSSGSAYPEGATMSSTSNRPLIPPTGPAGYGGGAQPGYSGWSGVPEVQDRER